MENSAEALKMAFAVFIFVMALSLTIAMFSKARETSDIVLKAADITQYYSYEEYEKNGNASENRIVSMETIIPTLYKYNKENYRVVFKKGGNLNNILANITNLDSFTNLNIYVTNEVGNNKYKNFVDLSDEISRAEPWTINSDEIKKHLDAILQSEKYTPVSGGADLDYSSYGLRSYLTNKSKFVECVGRIAADENDKNQTTTKTVITYILIQ